LKALEKDREKRYQSAAELAGDIRRYLKGEPTDARPPTAWIKACRWITRHPVFATCIACAFLGAIIIAGPLIVFWHLNTRPYGIVRLRDGMIVRANDGEPIDEVNLHTRSGNVLHTWGGKASSIVKAKLVARPSGMGGGKVALIGYNDNTVDSIRNTLSVYDLNGDLETPIWSQRIKTEDILFQLRRDRDFVGEQFCVRPSIVADVFPDSNHSGDEIVVIFGPETSQRIIRIYDLSGKLLYQVWHDGDMRPPYWMADARLLIFAGENALINWDRKGNPRNPDRNPFVVFALRPEPGHIGDSDYLQPEAGDDPLSPVWYKCLWLNKIPASRDHIQWVTTALPTGRNLGRIVRINILVDDKHSVCWTIDAFGNEIPNTRIPSDTYKRNQLLPDGDPDKLPNPDVFYLAPVPSIGSSSDGSEETLNQIPRIP